MSLQPVWLGFQMTTVCHFFPSIVTDENDTFAGGEVPMAFVVLTLEAARRVEQDPQMAERIKGSIVKVAA
jgi:hypothetical protein